MKKLIVLIMITLMGGMGVEIWRTIENRKLKDQIVVPEIIPYIKDSIIFEEKEINERMNAILNHQIPALAVELKDDGIVEVEFEIGQQLNALINSNNSLLIEKALDLFSGEKVSCEIQVKGAGEISIKGCSAAGIPLPDSVLRSAFQSVGEKVQDLIQKAGIEEIMVSMDKVEIKGNIQQALEFLEK